MEPAYLKLYQSSELKTRIGKALELLKSCTVCPRRCGVNRAEGEKGVCRSGAKAMVSSYGPHFGEESPLVGRFGSGTIFMTNCNLGCLFCQNFEISHLGIGEEVDAFRLADMMLALQRRGCHNINIVTPTHFVPQILESLPVAVEKGLRLPIVYNSGGYESLETLKLLDGVVDIYMPDAKYADSEPAKKYSNAPDYPKVMKAAIKEMHRQVGDLVINKEGIAERGLLVRHLVMPNGLAGTREIMRFLAQEVSKNTYVNVMAQYRPCGYAKQYPEISRSITTKEFEEAIKMALEEGITRLDERWVYRWG